MQYQVSKMPFSREFKKLVAARANADPDFRRGLIIDAINMILNGEITAGRIMLRHYIDATKALSV